MITDVFPARVRHSPADERTKFKQRRGRPHRLLRLDSLDLVPGRTSRISVSALESKIVHPAELALVVCDERKLASHGLRGDERVDRADRCPVPAFRHRPRTRSYLPYWSSVAGELRVCGEEGDPFDEGLSQEHPVEWILVERRERVDADGMFACDRQLDVTVVEERAAEHTRLDAEVLATETALDGDLPEARGGEEKLVFRIVEKTFRASGESLGLTRGPEEELRVEKELHADASGDAEQLSDFALAHAIEIAGNLDLPFQEPEPLRFFRRIERRHFHHRLPRFGDDERLALCRLFYEPRKLRLGLMNVDRVHGKWTNPCGPTLNSPLTFRQEAGRRRSAHGTTVDRPEEEA